MAQARAEGAERAKIPFFSGWSVISARERTILAGPDAGCRRRLRACLHRAQRGEASPRRNAVPTPFLFSASSAILARDRF